METKQAAAEALGSVLKAYTASGAREVFSLREEDGMFAIVPAKIVDQDGQGQSTTPIVDTRISLAPKNRTCAELLNDLCDSLTRITHVRVDCVLQLDPRILDSPTAVSGENTSVYSVLDQLITKMNTPTKGTSYVYGPDGQAVPKEVIFYGPPGIFSWQFRYTTAGGYVLNVNHTSVADN